MKKTDIPFFNDRKDLFKFLIENKATLMAEKKYHPKHGDGINITFDRVLVDTKGKAIQSKSNAPFDTQGLTQIKVSVAINSTNIMDSHSDVHLPGLWKKSLSENKLIKHLQEHEMSFDHIISDGGDLKAYTQNMSWKELGADLKGTTEVLTFDSTIKLSRNPYMFDQYAKGYVNNHSVGMQYVSLVMCIDDDSECYGAEYEAWQKYIGEVANQDAAIQQGYFWAVKEAKVIEGSAVPIGSNYATPTLDNNMKSKPGNHLENRPPKSTGINYGYLADNLNIN